MTETELINLTEYQMVADICHLLTEIKDRNNISDSEYEEIKTKLNQWRKKALKSIDVTEDLVPVRKT